MVLELQLVFTPYVHTLTSHSLIFNVSYSGNGSLLRLLDTDFAFFLWNTANALKYLSLFAS